MSAAVAVRPCLQTPESRLLAVRSLPVASERGSPPVSLLKGSLPVLLLRSLPVARCDADSFHCQIKDDSEQRTCDPASLLKVSS